MLYDYSDPTDAFKLASYLLNYDAAKDPYINKKKIEEAADLSHYTSSQIKTEISELVHTLKALESSSLTAFRHVRMAEHHIPGVHGDKSMLLEENHVYDKYIIGVLKEFCIITIALLVKLEKLHKKGVLCGNVNPYNFEYNRIRKECEPCDLSVVLSGSNLIKAEKQQHGDLQYIIIDLAAVPENRYLAPELKEAVHVYNMQRKLKHLVYLAETRGMVVEQPKDIQKVLLNFHLKKIKYSNKAEIYSVGYSINQILSHMLEKLARFGLMLHEPIEEKIPQEYIDEADALLPHEFENPYQERILELLNECVEYIHDLMHEHVEQRDSLPESIEKFKSLLKRISATTPDTILEREEEGEEVEFEGLIGEEHEHGAHEHVHEEHEHGHGHDHEHDHEHDAHGAGHGEHDAHESHGAGHGDHDAHEAHGAGHGEHDGTHESHGAGHGEHDGAHESHGAGHDEHGAGHGEHGHDDHGHDDHGHDDHGHDDHGHDDHGHDDHGHDDHGHDDHGHEAHGHDVHDAHGHDVHTSHDQSHADHGQGHAADSHTETHSQHSSDHVAALHNDSRHSNDAGHDSTTPKGRRPPKNTDHHGMHGHH